MLLCPSCGARQPDGAAFCEYCGQPLRDVSPVRPDAGAGVPASPAHPPTRAIAASDAAPVCPRCGAQLAPDSIFCDMCGAPLHGQHSSPRSEAGAYAPSSPGATQPAYVASPAVQARLVIQATQAVLHLPQGKSEVIVGRDDPFSNLFPDIDLTDYGGDMGGVSRQHARIFFQGRQAFIEDRDSTNHTYVNGEKLLPWQPRPLQSGDEICFGQLKANFYL